ncbi:MAG: acyl-CoA desaturase [Chthoniobacteraceae bacterium]
MTPAQKWSALEQFDDAPAHNAPHTHEHRRMALPQHLTMFFSVVGPIAGLVAAIVLLWHRDVFGVTWLELSLLLGLYALTAFGVTIGYHRLLTHRSFETYRPIRLLLAILASMGGQGAAIRWCATHRRHHQTADHDGDPHSPHVHGGTSFDLLRGMWHAHMGWLFHRDVPDTARSVPDLLADRAMLLIDKLYFFWVFLGILIPGVVVGLLTKSWTGFVSGAVWGGLARICLLQHVTWSINSVCHVWGTRPFRSADESTNNWLFALLAMGEGWHNNHHAFPTSARQGLRWWQFDSSWIIIRTLSAMGLAWNVRTPSPAALEAKAKVKVAA